MRVVSGLSRERPAMMEDVEFSSTQWSEQAKFVCIHKCRSKYVKYRLVVVLMTRLIDRMMLCGDAAQKGNCTCDTDSL